MQLAPIVLFTYNRLWHTQQTVEALKKNDLANQSKLFIYSDGPKNDADKKGVQEVRKYIKNINGFRRLIIVEREKNWGLADNIIDGITDIVNKYGKIIVLEDDLVASPYFLSFMNKGLDLYNDEDKVISIHGYIYPVRANLPETFFLKGADCWGWATWKRGWDQFEQDGQKLLLKLKKRKLEKAFDINGSYSYTKMLEDQIKGKINSWAIRWYASAFLNDKLTLYPGKSLVNNIGNDSSGVHCGTTDSLDTYLSNKPIIINRIPLEECVMARQEIEQYFVSLKPSLIKKLQNRIKRMAKVS